MVAIYLHIYSHISYSHTSTVSIFLPEQIVISQRMVSVIQKINGGIHIIPSQNDCYFKNKSFYPLEMRLSIKSSKKSLKYS